MLKQLNYDYSKESCIYNDTLDNARMEFHSNYRRMVKEQLAGELGYDDVDEVSVTFLDKYESDNEEISYQIRTYLARTSYTCYLVNVHISYYAESVRAHAWVV